MTSRRKVVGLTAVILAFGCVAAGVTATAASANSNDTDRHDSQHYPRSYEIGLFGDMPYGPKGRAQYPNVIADMNSQNLEFSVFDGDIKNGSEPCYADVDGSAQQAGQPDVYKYSLNLFSQFRDPVVYVPGDNEWTDCDRPSTVGPTFDSVDRLNYLRQVFFPDNRSLGSRTIRLTRQSPQYPENVRWTRGPVTYVGINVPGSNNNYIPDGDVKDGPQAEANAEYAARNAANLQWITDSFAAAKASGSTAIMITLQADMFGDSPTTPGGTTTDPTDHFADTKALLARAAVDFGKPVVLVNGDSHYFTVDKPLSDDAGNVIENFTRVMTFGSSLNHWVSATVDPTDPAVFSFHQHIITANLPVYTFN
ncbi:hypothetical protein [Frankia sp. Cas3]|uniref:hypothetical protein n=1 Tax=Frankia sp. Cas3 TaxID=3073926 RepID=UPI002AD53973|nr:hypothetical protein [Frankia sp. Cas3]